MGRRPELKSDEFFVFTPIVIEILSCEHFFTAEKVLPFIGASVRRAFWPLRAAQALWLVRVACVGSAGHRPQRAGRPRGRVTRVTSGTVSWVR